MHTNLGNFHTSSSTFGPFHIFTRQTFRRHSAHRTCGSMGGSSGRTHRSGPGTTLGAHILKKTPLPLTVFHTKSPAGPSPRWYSDFQQLFALGFLQPLLFTATFYAAFRENKFTVIDSLRQAASHNLLLLDFIIFDSLIFSSSLWDCFVCFGIRKKKWTEAPASASAAVSAFRLRRIFTFTSLLLFLLYLSKLIHTLPRFRDSHTELHVAFRWLIVVGKLFSGQAPSTHSKICRSSKVDIAVLKWKIGSVVKYEGIFANFAR